MGYRDSIEEFMSVMTGKTFVNNAVIDEGTGTLFIFFYNSYEEYKQDHLNTNVDEKTYDSYFSTGAKIEKLFVLESARILRDFDNIQTISMMIEFNGEKYNSNIDRKELNEVIGFDIQGLSPTDGLWSEFSDKYGCGKENVERKKLFEHFRVK